MRLRWSRVARGDLADIAVAIASDNPPRAQSFVDELLRSADKILDAPAGYPLVTDFASRGIRRRVHGKYLIFYLVDDQEAGGEIVILRVLHGARDYGSLLEVEGDVDGV